MGSGNEDGLFNDVPPPSDEYAPGSGVQQRVRGQQKSKASNVPARSAKAAVQKAQGGSKSSSLAEFIQQNAAELEKVAPDYMKGNIAIDYLLGAIETVPRLKECTPLSFITAAKRAFEIGVPIDGKMAMLIPYRDNDRGVTDARLQLDWHGIVYALNKNPDVAKVDAWVIREGDHYEEVHTEERDGYDFSPKLNNDGPVIAAMAKVTMRDGTAHWKVADMKRLKAAENASKSAHLWKDKKSNNYAKMCRKTALHEIWGFLPLSRRQLEAMQEHEAEESIVIDGNTGEILE